MAHCQGNARSARDLTASWLRLFQLRGSLWSDAEGRQASTTFAGVSDTTGESDELCTMA